MDSNARSGGRIPVRNECHVRPAVVVRVPASLRISMVCPLRMHGLDNLWVADASIFPTVPHVNTKLTAIMVGERVSDFIKAG
jgi:GMC oxidoreductase